MLSPSSRRSPLRIATGLRALSLVLAAATAAAPALAQPSFAGAPTSTRPITQPSFAQPATVAPQPLTPLPPGDYVLTITWYPQGAPGQTIPPTTDAEPVAVTNAGGTLVLTHAGVVYSGSIAADGNLHASASVNGRSVSLDGSAAGRHARGDAMKVLFHGIERGKFDIQPASVP